MPESVQRIIARYDPREPLERAATIPSAWYTDPRIAELERSAVFAQSWQCVARLDPLRAPGRFITADVAGESIVVVRGRDERLRAFFNVCRHHAAAVAAAPEGQVSVLRCPYHGWTYSLEGELKGTPEFDGVCDFDRARNGLVPLALDVWESFAFVRVAPEGPDLKAYLGDLAARVAPLQLDRLRFFERRVYDVNCNWKVYVDNYLDGGYHVPHAHKSLSSVLDYAHYTVEPAGRACIQSSPLASGGDAPTAAVRRGTTAWYFWLYPNFMLNVYEGVMDTNLVLPLGIDRCRVVFDYYFADVSPAAAEQNRRSIDVAERVQREDESVCESVQRGLRSRAYDVGRFSVRREAGEHLFHRLLHADLTAAASASAAC